jgi:tetratricopeptide (TPR) repeat protein
MRGMIYLLAVLIAASGGSGIAQAENISFSPLLRGALCAFAGRYDETIAVCDEVLRSEPENSRVYALRGYAFLLKKQNSKRAIADFSEVIRRHPDNAAIHVVRAKAYRQDKDYDRAIADYTAVIRLNPHCAEAYAGRGGCYMMKKVMGKAIADYTSALRFDPAQTWVLCARAEAYLWKNEGSRVLADLEGILRKDPDNRQAKAIRCSIYLFALRDFDRVIADTSELIRQDPNPAQWHSLRSVAYLAKGENAKGLCDAATAARLNPSGVKLALRPKSNSVFLGFGPASGDFISWVDDSSERIEACTKRLGSDPNNVGRTTNAPTPTTAWAITNEPPPISIASSAWTLRTPWHIVIAAVLALISECSPRHLRTTRTPCGSTLAIARTTRDAPAPTER